MVLSMQPRVCSVCENLQVPAYNKYSEVPTEQWTSGKDGPDHKGNAEELNRSASGCALLLGYPNAMVWVESI